MTIVMVLFNITEYVMLDRWLNKQTETLWEWLGNGLKMGKTKHIYMLKKSAKIQSYTSRKPLDLLIKVTWKYWEEGWLLGSNAFFFKQWMTGDVSPVWTFNLQNSLILDALCILNTIVSCWRFKARHFRILRNKLMFERPSCIQQAYLQYHTRVKCLPSPDGHNREF